MRGLFVSPANGDNEFLDVFCGGFQQGAFQVLPVLAVAKSFRIARGENNEVKLVFENIASGFLS